jgi:hypothetical protein
LHNNTRDVLSFSIAGWEVSDRFCAITGLEVIDSPLTLLDESVEFHVNRRILEGGSPCEATRQGTCARRRERLPARAGPDAGRAETGLVRSPGAKKSADPVSEMVDPAQKSARSGDFRTESVEICEHFTNIRRPDPLSFSLDRRTPSD